jgi:hypothetical protein
MSKSEFILLIPGIIYGVAMVDLLKIFRHSNRYWESVAWGIAMFLNLIVSWFGLYDKLEVISSNIALFTAYIISPLIFAQAVFVLTPEEEHSDTRAYFIKAQPLFYILILSYVVMNIILSFFLQQGGVFDWMRLILVPLFTVAIIWKNIWTRTLPLLAYFVFAIIIFASALI